MRSASHTLHSLQGWKHTAVLDAALTCVFAMLSVCARFMHAQKLPRAGCFCSFALRG